MLLQPREQKDNNDVQLCNFAANFKSLNQLNDAVDSTNGCRAASTSESETKRSMRSDCIALYTPQALANMLDSALYNYSAVNNNYNEDYKYYVTYTRHLVPISIDNKLMFRTKDATDTMDLAPVGPGMEYPCFACPKSEAILTQNPLPDFDGGRAHADILSFSCTNLSNYQQEAAYYTTRLTLKDRDGHEAALSKLGTTSIGSVSATPRSTKWSLSGVTLTNSSTNSLAIRSEAHLSCAKPQRHSHEDSAH